MTRGQAIREAKRLAKRKGHTIHVVYDVTYEELYGREEAWAICTDHDLDTYYATETPIFTAESTS